MFIENKNSKLKSINEEVFNLFNILVNGNCKIGYIGLSDKKDIVLNQILTSFSKSPLVKSDLEITDKDILYAFLNQESIIFNFRASDEICAIDRLVARLLNREDIKVDIAEGIVFSTIDFIVLYSHTKDDIVSISEVDRINKTVNPIIKYDYINDKFTLENKISKKKALYLIKEGISLDKIKRYT